MSQPCVFSYDLALLLCFGMFQISRTCLLTLLGCADYHYGNRPAGESFSDMRRRFSAVSAVSGLLENEFGKMANTSHICSEAVLAGFVAVMR